MKENIIRHNYEVPEMTRQKLMESEFFFNMVYRFVRVQENLPLPMP